MKPTVMLTALLLAPLATLNAADVQKPNILLILTDDQGWSQMSGLMDPQIAESHSSYLETPNIDRLAREGLRFTSGYSPAPLCTPTRRSIQCGTSAARSGGEFRSPWIPAEHLTIPKALKEVHSGYRCAHFGKWGEDMLSTPEECGYDASDGMTGNVNGGMPSSLGVASGQHLNAQPHFIDNDDPKRTRTITDRAIDFMRQQTSAGRPFYVQASYYAVHLSVVCREATLKKYQQKGEPDRGYTQAWAAMMEEMDAGVGRLLAALDELKIAQNTYVFFTADNGGRGTVPGGDASRLPPNHPLTGAKHSLYEGGIRVPFLARGPGIPPGSVCRTPVVGYDFLATFRELAGGVGALPGEVDGVSFRSLLSDPARDNIDRPQGGLYFHKHTARFSAIRQDAYKLLVFWKPDDTIQSRELYLLEPDPREQDHNIAGQQPAKADQLQRMLVDYLQEVNAQMPSEIAKKKVKPQRKPQAASRRGDAGNAGTPDAGGRN